MKPIPNIQGEKSPDTAFDLSQATADLAASELRYRRLFESARDGILILDAETGMVVDVNPFLIELLGFTREAFLGKAIWELGFFKDIVANQENFAKLQQTAYIRYDDKPLETADGRQVDVEFVSNVYLVHRKNVIQCNIRDITERKAYRDMSLKILQILTGPDGLHESIRRVLALVKTQTGTDAVGLRLQNGEDFLHTENTLASRGADGGLCRDEDGKVRLECTCGLVISGKADLSNPLFTPGGSFWTNDSAPLLDLTPEQDPRFHPRNKCMRQGYASIALIPIRDKEHIVGLLHLNARRRGCFSLTIIDFLENLASYIGATLLRVRAEEALRESAQMVEEIINAIPVRVFWKDKRLVFLGCNVNFARDAGFADPKDLIGKDDYQMGWRTQADLYRDDDRAVIESGCPKLLFEEPLTTPEGNTLTLLTSKMPLRNSQGEISGMLGVYYDITQRKRDEAELQKMEKLRSLGTLAGGIAHDFNNILQGLYGNVSLAMEDLAKTHPSYEFLDQAGKSMKRAVRLTRQLLTFAKGGDPVKESVSLGAMVGEVAHFDLTGSNVSLVCPPAKDLWPVDADKGQLQQVVSNLVINARQAMPNGGQLTITLENTALPAEAVPTLRQGRYVKVIVRDEGTGIDPTGSSTPISPPSSPAADWAWPQSGPSSTSTAATSALHLSRAKAQPSRSTCPRPRHPIRLKKNRQPLNARHRSAPPRSL